MFLSTEGDNLWQRGVPIVVMELERLPAADLVAGDGRTPVLSTEQFDTVNFAGIVLYKVGILLFNLVPYIALRIVA